jgi:[protein-PII] uridylyltransferase
MMNETGFLSRFIPEWWRIVGLMQFDTYHVFTVDEHTIQASACSSSFRAASWTRWRRWRAS